MWMRFFVTMMLRWYCFYDAAEAKPRPHHKHLHKKLLTKNIFFILRTTVLDLKRNYTR